MLANVVPQVPPREQVHHQVEVLPVLERVVHVDQKRVVELGEDLPLVNDTFDASFGDNTSFTHFFHGVALLAFLPLDLPHLPKAPLAHAVQVLEVGLR